MKTAKTCGARSKHATTFVTTCDNSLAEDELSKMIKMKEKELKQLQQKAEKLDQVEVLCQREKEFLLDQYKHVFGDGQHGAARGDLYENSEPAENNSGNRLYGEVHKLVEQINQTKQENTNMMYQIREARAVKEMKNIQHSTANQQQGVSIHFQSLLQKWFKAIKNQRNHSKNSVSGLMVPTTDKLFYNVKYQDVVHATVSPGNTSQARLLPGHFLEMVSFDTRHCGVCVGVIIASVQDDNTSIKSSAKQPKHPNTKYIITTDPCIDNSDYAKDFLHQSKPVEFVQQVVWKYIDTIAS